MQTTSKNLNGLYIGLISGTSCDGIDAALVELTNSKIELCETFFLGFDNKLRSKIIAISNGKNDRLDDIYSLDVELAYQFSKAVTELLKKAELKSSSIIAIGNHGQTIRHEPNKPLPYTSQIADPNIISYQTNILTVSDFRRKDIAANGQGAPLVPAFHAELFGDTKEKIILNIGGMANITHLKENIVKQGFDTGPGNVLLDAWVNHCNNSHYDKGGTFARSGKPSSKLLSKFLETPFFSQNPPKSIGRELFNLKWLLNILKDFVLTEQDIQATLVELTVLSILNDIKKYSPKATQIIVCGGGAKNDFLFERLKQKSGISTITSDEIDIPGDWVEAMAFAWLARQTLKNLPSNVPNVTGSKKELVLGGIYPV